MTPTDYNFEEVLELFESHGWKLQKVMGRYRVFIKPGNTPWLIPVEKKKVKAEHVEEIKRFFREEENEGGKPK